MSTRQERRRRRVLRRLSLVAAVLVAGVVGLAAVRAVQLQLKVSRAEAAGERGVEAFEAGRYAEAARALSTYLQRFPGHAERQRLRALAWAELPATPRRVRHVRRGLDAAVSLNPELQPAWRDLADFALEHHAHEDAVQAGRRLLEFDPDDALGLRAVGLGLARQGAYEEALPVLDRLMAVAEDDTRARLARLQVRHELGEPREVLVGDAMRWLRQRIGDPRAMAVLAYAHLLDGESAAARELLTWAAARPTRDPAFLADLLQLLDAAGMFPLALDTLAQADPQPGEPLFHELVWRLFEAERDADLLDRLAEAEPRSIAATGLGAVAARRLGRTDAARAFLAELASPGGDPYARRWRDVVLAATTPDADPAALRSAAARYPGQAYFQAAAGWSLQRAGEGAFAEGHFRHAGRLRPSWAAPRLGLARVWLAQGRPEAALEAAAGALLRLPDDPDAIEVYARARLARIDTDPRDNAVAALAELRALERDTGSDRALLVPKVEALVRLGRDEDAARLIDAALSFTPEVDLPARKALELAAIAREHALPTRGSPQAWTAHALEAAGDPTLWQARALWELRRGDAAAALATADDARHRLGPQPWTEFLHHHADLVRYAASSRALRPILLSALTDPDARPVAMEALTAIRTASPDTPDPTAAAAELQRLATRPHAPLALKTLAAQAQDAQQPQRDDHDAAKQADVPSR